MTTSTSTRLLAAFAREGARAFFRPKPSEAFQLPRHTQLDDVEEEELARRPHSYLYTGAAIEFLVAIALFIAFVSVGASAQFVMTEIVERYGNLEKWSGLIDLFSGGLTFIGLALLIVFVLKLIRDIVARALNI